MLRMYSRLQDAAVISLHTSTQVAKIDDLFIDFNSGKILGLYLHKTGFLFPPNTMLLSQNIVEWSNAIYIQSEDSISELSELVRYEKKLSEDFSIFGLKTYTKEGKYIGKVSDIMIETMTMTLRKIEVERGFAFWKTQLLVPLDQVYKITSQRLIVNDIRSKIHLRMESRKKLPALD